MDDSYQPDDRPGDPLGPASRGAEPDGLIGSDPYAPRQPGGEWPRPYRRHLDAPTDSHGPAHGFGRFGLRAQPGMKAAYIQPGTRLPVDPADLAENSASSSFAHWGTALIGFWAPMLVFLMKKDHSPYARLHASEALNFMVIMVIGYCIAGALSAIFIGVLALPVLYIWQLVAVIGAAGAASRGEMPKYWLPFRVFS